MKKIALLLAVVLLVGMVSACKKEAPAATTTAAEKAKPTTFTVNNYAVTIPAGEGWSVVEEENPTCDLLLTNGSAAMSVVVFAPGDTVDPLSAEDVMIECNDRALAGKTDVTLKEDTATSSATNKTVMTMLYSAKDGNTAKEYFFCVASFTDGSEYQVWVGFSAGGDYISKNKATLKSIVDKITCSAGSAESDDAADDELYFDENGELIEDPEYIEGAEGLEGSEPTNGTDGFVPSGDETEPVEDTEPVEGSEPTGTTEAVEGSESTGTTNATDATETAATTGN